MAMKSFSTLAPGLGVSAATPAVAPWPCSSTLRPGSPDAAVEAVVAEPKALRNAYLEVFQEHQNRIRKGCLANGVDFRVLQTDTPLDVALTSYLALRARRGARR